MFDRETRKEKKKFKNELLKYRKNTKKFYLLKKLFQLHLRSYISLVVVIELMCFKILEMIWHHKFQLTNQNKMKMICKRFHKTPIGQKI